MRAQEIMSANPQCCTPSDTIERAAKTMEDCDCGCLPVVEDANKKRVVGVITDRDITVRAVARGKSPTTKIGDIMSPSMFTVSADADIAEVERTMAEKQVRRVIIVDKDQCCVGIVSQADIARAAKRRSNVTDQDIAVVVESISAPRTHTSGSPPPS